MSVTKRAWNSLRDQGVRRTGQTLLAIMGDYWFDWRYGLDTVREVRLEELNVPKPSAGALDYQASRTRYFRRLLQRIEIKPDSTFVDLGAGKGRTLVLASERGFRSVVGVEFSPELCSIARRNVEAYTRWRAATTAFDVVNMDATRYEFRDDQDVLYVTAFATESLRSILDNVARSLERAPRELTLIYHNPHVRDLIDSYPAFRRTDEFAYGSETAFIYLSAPAGAGRSRANGASANSVDT
jgi:SAM-dependent methyltransferase